VVSGFEFSVFSPGLVFVQSFLGALIFGVNPNHLLQAVELFQRILRDGKSICQASALSGSLTTSSSNIWRASTYFPTLKASVACFSSIREKFYFLKDDLLV
jgi:hypothetical protein